MAGFSVTESKKEVWTVAGQLGPYITIVGDSELICISPPIQKEGDQALFQKRMERIARLPQLEEEVARLNALLDLAEESLKWGYDEIALHLSRDKDCFHCQEALKSMHETLEEIRKGRGK